LVSTAYPYAKKKKKKKKSNQIKKKINGKLGLKKVETTMREFHHPLQYDQLMESKGV
jgi:hypothetical protein